MMYMPIWILYWFPIFLPINYGIKVAIINIVLWISKKVKNTNEVYDIITVIKTFCFNVVSELVGIAIFYIFDTNTETVFYYDNYLAFCLLAFISTVVLNFTLNYIFVLKKFNVSIKQKIILTTLLVLATAPYMFLLPSGRVC